VKLVVLAPLLSLAGFFRHPFHPEAEAEVRISAEDEGEIVRGKIDVLVLQRQLWVAVIESKSKRFSVDEALPQALFYMMGNPNALGPTFGFVTNGSHFRFIKLTKQSMPQYALSSDFSLAREENELYRVLSVLKRLGELITK
jgi:type I site-specific restriction endonuclease